MIKHSPLGAQRSQELRDVLAELNHALARLDALGLHQEAAHMAMAVDALERRIVDAPRPDVASR